MAIFDSQRWAQVGVGGVSLFSIWSAVLAVGGVLLLLLDLVPLLSEWAKDRRANEPEPAAVPLRLSEMLTSLCSRMTLPTLPLRVLPRATPALFCVGIRQPTLCISEGALAALDDEELRMALAHELSHVTMRDPLIGWILLVTRGIMFFNPVFQIVARLLAREMEWRADDHAVAAEGNGLALSGALLKLYRLPRHGRPARLAWLPALHDALAHLESEAVARRCRRLIDGPPSPAPGFVGTRLALTAGALLGLLFFVV